MSAADVNRTPATAYTLSSFIELGRATDIISYTKLCYRERHGDISYVVKNVLDDYIYEMKTLAVKVQLDSKELMKYKYNPKVLSYDLYGTTEFYPFILILNDMCNIHQFDLSKKTLYLITRNVLADSLSKIYNSNIVSIAKFNNNHLNDITTKIIEPYRPQR